MYRIAQSNSVDTATDPSGILSGEYGCCWCEVNVFYLEEDEDDDDDDGGFVELETELQQKPKTSCVTQLTGTRNLWKNTVVLCVNS